MVLSFKLLLKQKIMVNILHLLIFLISMMLKKHGVGINFMLFLVQNMMENFYKVKNFL